MPEMLLKYTYFIVLCCFLAAFILNFVVNLIRDVKVKKQIKTNPQRITGTVRECKKIKNRIYLVVEFTSQHNRLLFSEQYELFEGDINVEDYPEGKEVELLYNDVSEQKKVRNFPLLLADLKVKLEKGPLFLNIALVVMGAFILGQTLINYIRLNAFNDPSIPLVGENGIFQNYLYILLMLVVYFVVVNYMITSLVDTPHKEVQNYLKIYGNVAKARVKTYKFGRNKDSKGNKESQIELEFSTNEGVQVQGKLNSFLYTETQEEYIDIIYDPKNPKSIVYLKN